MSLGSPCGAPESTHFTMVAICASLSDMSFWKLCTPTLLSRCHGGIWRFTTRSLMERAHGRASSYVSSDIGAIALGRWHSWQRACRIGAMSLVNVGALVVCVAPAVSPASSMAPVASTLRDRRITVPDWNLTLDVTTHPSFWYSFK